MFNFIGLATIWIVAAIVLFLTLRHNSLWDINFLEAWRPGEKKDAWEKVSRAYTSAVNRYHDFPGWCRFIGMPLTRIENAIRQASALDVEYSLEAIRTGQNPEIYLERMTVNGSWLKNYAKDGVHAWKQGYIESGLRTNTMSAVNSISEAASIFEGRLGNAAAALGSIKAETGKIDVQARFFLTGIRELVNQIEDRWSAEGIINIENLEADKARETSAAPEPEGHTMGSR
jgi:hypothetical protein